MTSVISEKLKIAGIATMYAHFVTNRDGKWLSVYDKGPPGCLHIRGAHFTVQPLQNRRRLNGSVIFDSHGAIIPITDQQIVTV